MKLYDVADLLSVNLIITRYPNQNDRYTAQLEGCKVSENGFLVGVYGDGNTPMSALENYWGRIKGKKIVFNAMDKERRREFYVPEY